MSVLARVLVRCWERERTRDTLEYDDGKEGTFVQVMVTVAMISSCDSMLSDATTRSGPISRYIGQTSKFAPYACARVRVSVCVSIYSWSVGQFDFDFRHVSCLCVCVHFKHKTSKLPKDTHSI